MITRVFAHLLVDERCPYVRTWFARQFGEIIHIDAHDTYVYMVYEREGQRKHLQVKSAALLLALIKSKYRVAACSALWSCAIFYDENLELDRRLYDLIAFELGTRLKLVLPFTILGNDLTVVTPWTQEIPSSTDLVIVEPETNGIRLKLPLDSRVVMNTIAEDLRRKQL